MKKVLRYAAQGAPVGLAIGYAITILLSFCWGGGEYLAGDDEELLFEGAPVAYRGLFLIDRSGVVRHMVINDLPLGRNVDEVLRMVDALQHFEEYGEVCPANWAKGREAMNATDEGVSDYLSKH